MLNFKDVMKKGLLLIIFIILLQSRSFAQLDLSGMYTYPAFDTTANNDLLFRLESNGFFKNDEYFSDYVEGYTLPGFILQPELVYYAGSRLRIRAGVNLTQIFGNPGLADVSPVFSLQIKAAKRFDIILGALKGSVHHGLVEPVFNPEFQYLKPVDYGVQFLYDSYRFKMDAWIDWEQFITWGDTIPERFTAGFTGDMNITNEGSSWGVSVPLQILTSHQSGQISDYNEPSYSLLNVMTGFKVVKNTDAGLINKLWFDGDFLVFKELSGDYGIPYESGIALYPVAGLDYKYGQFMLGYWYADNFFALKGNPEFMSVSNYKDHYSRYRHLVTMKLYFIKKYSKQIKLNAGVELYYDFSANQLDYSYGLSIVYTPIFKILTIASK